MGLSNITALINGMTTPDSIIMAFDVTGWWADATMYGLALVIILSTGDRYQRLSHRFAVSMFLTSILSTFLYSVNWLQTYTFYRVLVGLILSMVWLYVDKTPEDAIE